VVARLLALGVVVGLVASCSAPSPTEIFIYNSADEPILVEITQGPRPAATVAVPPRQGGRAGAFVGQDLRVATFTIECMPIRSMPIIPATRMLLLLEASGEPAISILDSAYGAIAIRGPNLPSGRECLPATAVGHEKENHAAR